MPEAVAASACICRRCGYTSRDEPEGTRCPNDGDALITQAEDRAHPRNRFLGRVVAGKYPIVGIVGGGGMGAVYRAIQEPVGREVALKIIQPHVSEGSTGESTRARFMREAQVVAALNSAATVRLYDYGADADGTLFMVLELIRGEALNRIIAGAGALSARRTARIGFQVLNALAEAHAMGLIHRDVKPHNIMVELGPFGEEQIKVLDFGIAKMMSTADTGESLTGGGIVGTPLYMPPEQAVAKGAEARSDLYALGCVMFEMLAGHPPYGGASTLELLLAHRDQPVAELPQELEVPEALRAIVRRAMQKKPEDRFPDATAMATALLQAVPDLGEVQPELTPQPGTDKRRRPLNPLRPTPLPPAAARTPVGGRLTARRTPDAAEEPPIDSTVLEEADDGAAPEAARATVLRSSTPPVIRASTRDRVQPPPVAHEPEDDSLFDVEETEPSAPSRRRAGLLIAAVAIVGALSIYWVVSKPSAPSAAPASRAAAAPAPPAEPSPTAAGSAQDSAARTPEPPQQPSSAAVEPVEPPRPAVGAAADSRDPTSGAAAEPKRPERTHPEAGTRRERVGKGSRSGGKPALDRTAPVEDADDLRIPTF